MTRSKDNNYTQRHDRHVARNGQTEARFGVKKSGAGTANWGVLGDEVPDVQEFARQDIGPNSTTGTKLNLVDSETFETMRNPEQQS